MNFDFLKDIVVDTPVKSVATKSNIAKNPENGMTLRVFANGKVYPSQELVNAVGLAYQPKGSENPGMGFDIFRSSKWIGFPETPQECLFIAGVSKSLPKVDLFGSCTFNEDGTPKTDVMTQGGGKFGKELAGMVEGVFGITIPQGGYVDITINTDITIPSTTGFYQLPKTSKKADGSIVDTTVRRENISIFPMSLNMTEELEAQLNAPTESVVEEKSVPEAADAAPNIGTFKEALDTGLAEPKADAAVEQAMKPVAETAPVMEESAPANPFAVEAPVVEQAVAPQVNPFAQEAEASAATPSMPDMPDMPAV